MSPSRRARESREGQEPFVGAFTPMLAAAGTSPPAVSVVESAFSNARLHVQILTPGILGIGAFQYSINGGALQIGITLGASVALPLLPLVSLQFAAGTYAADNTFDGIV